MKAVRVMSVATAAMLAVALAACSSSKGGGTKATNSPSASTTSASAPAPASPTTGGSSSSPAPASTANAPSSPAAVAGGLKCGLSNGQPATGAPIKIGSISTMSGGIDFSSAPKTAKAYFDCVNANGGINGRPISYDMGDDALDPTKGSALATKYASDTSYVAMAGGASFVSCGLEQPVVAKANLYDIVGTGVPQPCYYSSNLSAMNAGPRLSYISAIQEQVKDNNIKTFGGGSYSIPGLGDWVQAGGEAYAKANGLTQAYYFLVPPPLKNATSFVTQMKAKKLGTFVPVWSAPDNATFLKAAEQQGVIDSSTTLTCATPCYDTTFPAQIGKSWFGKFWSNSEFNLLDSTGPDNTNWKAVLDKYGTSAQPRDSFSQGGYLAAEALVKALLTVDPKNITRDTVSKAVSGIVDFQSDMLCKPWYFSGPNGHNNANHQLHNVKLNASGHYDLASDCFETADPALADILAFEKANPAAIGG